MPSMAMLLGRLLLSAIFIQAGVSKVLNVGATIGYFSSLGLPFPSLTLWVVVALEVIGGLCVVLGYRIRIAAGLLALFSIAAAIAGHSNFSDSLQLQAFMKDLAIAGGLFYVAANGAGMLSFDARRD
jgi:putative oxidoreductase